ncbi:EI24 domain-containing protein [Salinibacterium sp. PAMC 21357]|uniref:EI24 domain-containing protein n=1 Tax=Salinibacterium sp. PAMC 21357 TaxID=1112215 RepID=UPI000287BDDD|nr:EI24 domain-containing protein [Salinibacterium sp. PAMC 21357]
MNATSSGSSTPLREFFRGVSFLFKGFRIWVSAPRLMFLGMIPAAIVGTLSIGLFVALIVAIEPIAEFLTPFADDWDELPRAAVQFAAGLAVIVSSILIIVNAFATVTLMVGDAFYRKIAGHVDSRHGSPATPAPQGFWKDARRGLAEGLRLLFPTVGLALFVFALGFIPIVGTVVAATIGALVGGWLLVVELANIPFESRGMHLTARRRVLRLSRAKSLGFGAATYLVFLIPFGAVIAMPAALAGATLLTRSLLGEDTLVGNTDALAEPAEQPPAS